MTKRIPLAIIPPAIFAVMVTYTTDFERHRIKSLRKNPAKSSNAASASPPAIPPAEKER